MIAVYLCAVDEKPLLTFAPSKWETVDESELEAQGLI